MGDFNGDGKPDLAVANLDSDTVTILLGNGDGTFKAAASPETGIGSHLYCCGGLQWGRQADLAVANYLDFTVTILLGNGDGTFTVTASKATGVNPSLLRWGTSMGTARQTWLWRILATLVPLKAH